MGMPGFLFGRAGRSLFPRGIGSGAVEGDTCRGRRRGMGKSAGHNGPWRVWGIVFSALVAVILAGLPCLGEAAEPYLERIFGACEVLTPTG